MLCPWDTPTLVCFHSSFSIRYLDPISDFSLDLAGLLWELLSDTQGFFQRFGLNTTFSATDSTLSSSLKSFLNFLMHACPSILDDNLAKISGFSFYTIACGSTDGCTICFVDPFSIISAFSFSPVECLLAKICKSFLPLLNIENWWSTITWTIIWENRRCDFLFT